MKNMKTIIEHDSEDENIGLMSSRRDNPESTLLTNTGLVKKQSTELDR